jgi:serine/threonine protein kinase
MTRRQDALEPGTALEGYRFDEMLGAGGFGITYRAVELTSGRTVAIKEFLPSALAHRGRDGHGVTPLSAGLAADFAFGLGRFREEARTLVSLAHPNVVAVLRYFEANGTGYLVMAWAHGESLGQRLAAQRVLAESDARRLALALLDGLGAVHARGFLHRDVKPDNIFVRADGAPVLLDFGAARRRLLCGGRGCAAGVIVTPGYAPAEQYECAGDQGPWTDIYALGAVLYRALAGERPPDAPARLSARRKGRVDPMLTAAKAAAGRAAPAFLAAIDAALAIDPEDRPQSTAAFAALLTAAPPARRPRGELSRRAPRPLRPGLLGWLRGAVASAVPAPPGARFPFSGRSR